MSNTCLGRNIPDWPESDLPELEQLARARPQSSHEQTWARLLAAPPKLEVDDKLKQAVWRLMGNGNPYYQTYFPKKGSPKRWNDDQACVGHWTEAGRDTTARAGKYFYFTPDWCDREQWGFGFYTRSELDEKHPGAPQSRSHQKYRYGGLDIEPEGKEHATRIDIYLATQHAYTMFKVWKDMAVCLQGLEYVGLFYSSNFGHWHIYILFEEEISQAKHDQYFDWAGRRAHNLVKRNSRWLLCPRMLDKDSTRAKNDKGDQFRAPWTWKKGLQSYCVKQWCRDPAKLIRLGAELLPESCRPQSEDSPPAQPFPTSLADQIDYCVTKFELTPGNRYHKSGQLILSLLNRNLDPARVREIGIGWLKRFKVYETDLEFQHDLKLFDYDLNRTVAGLASGKLPPATCDPAEYVQAAAVMQLSARQLDFISGSQRSETNDAPSREGASCFLPLKAAKTRRWTVWQRHTLEALFIQVRLELTKGKSQVEFTREQLLEIISVRHPKFKLCPGRIFSARHMSNFVSMTGNRQPKARMVELLVRIRTGHRAGGSVASLFQLTPEMVELMREGER